MMLQQETFLFTFICIVVFVHGAKGKEINKNGNYRNKPVFDTAIQSFQTAKNKSWQ